jgi:hypothetical protein
VEQDENPQKYLYQAYRRRWKLYKIYQMFEKLALLGITLYVSQTKANTWRRLAGATGLASVSLIIVVIGHPLNDKWEAALDITSRFVHKCPVCVVGRELCGVWKPGWPTRSIVALVSLWNLGWTSLSTPSTSA